MKENPAMQKVIDNMKPGVISLHGFLGNDKRSIEEIIDHDASELELLGKTAGELADGLERIRDKALAGLGDYIEIGGGFTARADSIRGKLPCPFNHAGIYRKTVISLREIETGEELLFTDLGIHMIRDHGFFQGRGSIFRLEPAVMAELITSL